jgi:hypothetical protein
MDPSLLIVLHIRFGANLNKKKHDKEPIPQGDGGATEEETA